MSNKLRRQVFFVGESKVARVVLLVRTSLVALESFYLWVIFCCSVWIRSPTSRFRIFPQKIFQIFLFHRAGSKVLNAWFHLDQTSDWNLINAYNVSWMFRKAKLHAPPKGCLSFVLNVKHALKSCRFVYIYCNLSFMPWGAR